MVLAFAFVFQSMVEINSHTYTNGVDSYHLTNGCISFTEDHLAVKCKFDNCAYN